MVFLQQTPKVFKKKGDKHMGDVVLRKGKEKKRGEVSVSTASPRSSTASTMEIRSKKAPMRLQRPNNRPCALSHSANSAIVVGSILFLQNESEFTQMPRMSPENQSNQCKGTYFLDTFLSYLCICNLL